jgi:hypothetical protein
VGEVVAVTDLHIPAPRTPDYEAIHLDLVRRIQDLIDEFGPFTYVGIHLAAALRGEDE